MTSATRLTIFTVVVAAIVVAAGAYLYLAPVESSTTSTGPPRLADDASELEVVARIRKGAHVAFRDLAPGPTYGHLTFAPLENRADRIVTAADMQPPAFQRDGRTLSGNWHRPRRVLRTSD